MIGRALLTWLLMVVVAILNAGFREKFLTPNLGEQTGHIIGTGVGCAALLLVMWASLPWIRASGRHDLLILGALWLALTIAFEFLAGHYLFGNSWEKLLADYNVARGRIWVAVLVVVFLGPLWMGRLRGIR